MLIVYKAYEDGSADLIDIPYMNLRHYTEKQLLGFIEHNHSVIGLSASSGETILTTYIPVQFPSESEAYEHCEDRKGLSSPMFISGYWWVIIPSNNYETRKQDAENKKKRNKDTEPKEYCVYYECGSEISYVAGPKQYTPYIQSAMRMSEERARKTAENMTKYSRTYRKWNYKRVESWVVK